MKKYHAGYYGALGMIALLLTSGCGSVSRTYRRHLSHDRSRSGFLPHRLHPRRSEETVRGHRAQVIRQHLLCRNGKVRLSSAVGREPAGWRH